jgi:hypothetical protein
MIDDSRDGIKAADCPKCGLFMDAATAVDGSPARPKEGDFSVCFSCAQIFRFDAELQPVLCLPAELAELETGRTRVARARRPLDQVGGGRAGGAERAFFVMTLLRSFPHEDILGRDGSLYMRRYRLFGDQARWPSLFGLNIMIHCIARPDEDRDPHDHPWGFLSFILRGGYVEERWGASHHGPRPPSRSTLVIANRRAPLSFAFRRATDLHRIVTLADGGPCWTVVITTRRSHEWGFWTEAGWIPHGAYLAERQFPGPVRVGRS